MEPHAQYPMTLVTAYFDVGGKPEFSENPYPGWIRNFLPHVRWPLIIFCDEQSVDMLKEARGDKPAVWHVTRPEEFYVYKYLDDLRRLQFPAEHAETCVTRSLIWHEKHHFLRQALSENPFGSEMLFWVDIGCFRNVRKSRLISALELRFQLSEDVEWPNLQVCRAMPQDKAAVIAQADYRLVEDASICAQFFGGAINPARQWCDAYYRLLEKRQRNGSLPHVEETVMKSCWKQRRELAYGLPLDVGWLRPAVFLSRYLVKHRRGPTFKWYLLSGRKFPWRYFCRAVFCGPKR